MFLKQIKIIGFKSFVESTVIEFRSDRVAIVGPNGCGKSNIIDAIRWVMGESSPKFLRGDLMADVIFNGSMHRKPMGLASVEIILDNAQNLLQGAYVKKGDVSLRREVNRSGESSYFINQQRVRRKDLSDLWLGTGAGARGYAIIGQNMVNQLVEANPEALKAYLEEAAGVSKYKERRKESAARLAVIHENTARILDIVSELSTQLERLAREAGDAKQYHLLKEQLKAQESALQYAKYNAILQKQAQLASKQGEGLSEQHALSEQLISHDSQLKEMDVFILDLQAQVQQGEQELYKLQMDLSQQEHLYAKQMQDKSRYASEKEELLQEIENLSKEKSEQALFMTTLHEKQSVLETKQASLTQEFQKQSSLNQDKEVALKKRYAQKHDAKQELQAIETQIQVLNVKLEQAEHNIHQYKHEMQNAHLNQYTNEMLGIEQELQELKLNIDECVLAKQNNEQEYHRLQSQVETASNHLTKAQIDLKALEKNYQHLLKERLSAQASYEGLLSSIQKSNIDIGGEQLKAWLETWQVPSVWQSVVDFLWQHFLPHGFVDNFETHDGEGGYLSMLNDLKSHDPKTLVGAFGLKQIPSGFFNWSTIQIAHSKEDALLQRSSLQCHESIMTADGFWLGPDWQYQLSFDEKGLASRLQLYKKLQVDFLDIEKRYQQAELECQEQQQQHQTLFLALQEHEAIRKHLSGNIDSLLQKKSHLEQKYDFYQQEQSKKTQALHRLETRYVEASQVLKNCQSTLDSLQTKQKQLASHFNEIMSLIHVEKNSHESLLEAMSVLRHERDSITQDLFKSKTQMDVLEQELPKLDKRITVAEARLLQVNAAMLALNNDDLWSPERVLQGKLLLEGKNEMLLKMRESLESAHAQKQKLNSSMEGLKKQELQCLEKKWRIQAEEEQIAQAQKELEQGFLNHAEDRPWTTLKAHENERYFNQQISSTESALQALGDVNLLALGLYDEERSRYDALLAQQQDLQDAMKELEQAIETLDQDMQLRLEMTLKSINMHLIDIFPQLFGGGQAKFVASCDNLLEATVAVHVQLPGKKQHRIQLLSGGEKALTAVALLFAIFSLNPAPFCLLDEVDAALDDANVQRLANLIKSLSQKVQFVLITHNPLTMDAADDLIGVTMQEAGVSRVVSVNMAKALEMVNKES